MVLLPDEPLIGRIVRGSDGRLYLVLGDKAVPVEVEERDRASGLVLSFSVNDEVLRAYREWLSSRHRRRPVRDSETVEKYVSYLRKFHRCSGGIISPDTIMRCVTNKHVVRALRAFLEMLVFYGKAPRSIVEEFLSRLRWSEKQGIAEDEVPLSRVLESLAHCLERCRWDYRMIYLALFYSGGVRLEQLLSILPLEPSLWLPRGNRPRPYGRYNAARALEEKGAASKPIDWLWLPKDLYEALREVKPPGAATARMYYSKHRIVTPTLIRSFCWQAGKYVLGDKDLVRLMQGRLGELKRSVTARSYDALRYQLDELYPRWLVFVDKLVEAVRRNDPVKEADRLRSEYKLPLPA